MPKNLVANREIITMNEEDSYDTLIRDTVDAIIAAEINFVAVDFDDTLINEHTGGKSYKKPEELAKMVRPIFRRLIPALAERNVHIAIVTFSGQSSLVQGVVDAAFGKSYKILIRGNGPDEQWRACYRQSQPGKLAHMASAAHEISQTHSIEITKASTLLIDDDTDNVATALKAGARAVVFENHLPEAFAHTIINLSQIHCNTRRSQS
eukprot:gene9866-10912_t